MAIDLAEKSSGPAPEFLASSPPDNSKCPQGPGGISQDGEGLLWLSEGIVGTEYRLTGAPHAHSLRLCFKLNIQELNT